MSERTRKILRTLWDALATGGGSLLTKEEDTRWALVNEQAAHGQTAHVRQRLQEELSKVREALESSGYEYCEGYDVPIRRLIEERDRLREANRDLCQYVKDAAGDESVLLPISTLNELISKQQLADAVMQATNMDMLRRCHEDRSALKQEMRTLKAKVTEKDEAVHMYSDQQQRQRDLIYVMALLIITQAPELAYWRRCT